MAGAIVAGYGSVAAGKIATNGATVQAIRAGAGKATAAAQAAKAGSAAWVLGKLAVGAAYSGAGYWLSRPSGFEGCL